MVFTPKQLKMIAKLAYPDYNGRKFRQKEVTEIDTSYNANWSGGSRTYYTFVRIDGKVMENPNEQLAPWHRDSDKETVKLVQGLLCVTHTYFFGHDIGCTVYSLSTIKIENNLKEAINV